MTIRFGPAGLGPVKTAEQILEKYNSLGLKACEIAFTHSVYIKPEDAVRIGKKAQELGIRLSIHAPYFVNLNSQDTEKREATKLRILKCCEIGELLGAKLVVFHPGYYSTDKEETYKNVKRGVLEILKEKNARGFKIKIAPETMGKVNVFGSVDEISRLVKDTGCSFCIDYAHILAREKSIDYKKIESLFPEKEWHLHFSGIVYGEKGEKNHKTTEKKDWEDILRNLPKDKEITIINESPTLLEDSIQGLGIYNKLYK